MVRAAASIAVHQGFEGGAAAAAAAGIPTAVLRGGGEVSGGAALRRSSLTDYITAADPRGGLGRRFPQRELAYRRRSYAAPEAPCGGLAAAAAGGSVRAPGPEGGVCAGRGGSRSASAALVWGHIPPCGAPRTSPPALVAIGGMPRPSPVPHSSASSTRGGEGTWQPDSASDRPVLAAAHIIWGGSRKCVGSSNSGAASLTLLPVKAAADLLLPSSYCPADEPPGLSQHIAGATSAGPGTSTRDDRCLLQKVSDSSHGGHTVEAVSPRPAAANPHVRQRQQQRCRQQQLDPAADGQRPSSVPLMEVGDAAVQAAAAQGQGVHRGGVASLIEQALAMTADLKVWVWVVWGREVPRLHAHLLY